MALIFGHKDRCRRKLQRFSRVNISINISASISDSISGSISGNRILLRQHRATLLSRSAQRS